MNHTCMDCKRTYATERTDSVFCSDECKARWFRNHGRTGQHSNLDDHKSKCCGCCGSVFWFNAYADRAGARQPTYCCDKCRIDAWRIQNTAKKAAEREARENPRSWDNFRQQERQQQHSPKPPPQNAVPGDWRDRLTIPRRWDTVTAMEWIVGKDAIWATEDEIREEWRKLAKQFHPDVNGGKVYKHLSTINAAYGYLKSTWKRERSR